MKALGPRMRAAIEESGLQHQEIARKMRIGAPALSRYVNGHQDPRAKYVARFVCATGCDANWLLGVKSRRK